MKIAIAYAGKTGTTEKCAGLLGEKLQGAVLINLCKEEINLKKYDLIILGSSIRMGVIHPKVREVITNNMEAILKKKMAMFICCGNVGEWKNNFINNIPKQVLDSFITYNTFGGEMNLEKLKGMDKFIIKMVSKNNKSMLDVKIDKHNIDDFAKIINKTK